ncbi:MAG: hypothetical protein CMK74_00150 [Pseudomonadales bacterium]|jgi:hypothetical protein|nr:hypothetical protein [Pseudomonadales bacterium]|tara:strand:+ start:402 stop:632 length:231 start_codon:yes stop_codon:yes gene_type:complete
MSKSLIWFRERDSQRTTTHAPPRRLLELTDGGIKTVLKDPDGATAKVEITPWANVARYGVEPPKKPGRPKKETGSK